MLRTRICELLGIEHPIVLGGMGTGTSPALVAAVSEAGGLGVLGATQHGPAEMAREAAAIRALTARPFGLNLLLFRERPEQYDGLLAARPSVVSTAWPSIDQDLAGYVSRAHAVGARFMHMVSTVAEAKAAAGSRPRWPGGPTGCCWAPASWPATRRRSPRASRRPSSRATATTPWSPTSPTWRTATCGPAPTCGCGATGSSRSGSGARTSC